MNPAKFPVVSFQFQSQRSKEDTFAFLQSLDANMPIPQVLEGGDGNGSLYQCILDDFKKKYLFTACDEHTDIRIYGRMTILLLERSAYRADWYVHWSVGSDPTVTSEKN
jgi:hypothetical protein